MELVSGLMLWMADVAGLKWVRNERNNFVKVVKAVTFMVVGFVFVVLFFMVWG